MSVPATLLTPPPSQRSSMARLHTRVFFPGEASKAYAVPSATPVGLRGASPPSMMAPHTAGAGRHTGGPTTHSSSHRLQTLAHAEPSRLRRPRATDLPQGDPSQDVGLAVLRGPSNPQNASLQNSRGKGSSFQSKPQAQPQAPFINPNHKLRKLKLQHPGGGPVFTQTEPALGHPPGWTGCVRQA